MGGRAACVPSAARRKLEPAKAAIDAAIAVAIVAFGMAIVNAPSSLPGLRSTM
jgi:hypothetical protein